MIFTYHSIYLFWCHWDKALLIEEVKPLSCLSIFPIGDVIALNKPSGVAVHSGPKVKNDLSHHLHLWQYGEASIPELAHRLDK